MAVILKFLNNKTAEMEALEVSRPTKRLGGGWLADLAACNKAIMLCSNCQNKWDHKSYNYKRRDIYPGQRIALGTCDGCNTRYSHCFMYFKELS